jgi:hypothetical protein
VLTDVQGSAEVAISSCQGATTINMEIVGGVTVHTSHQASNNENKATQSSSVYHLPGLLTNSELGNTCSKGEQAADTTLWSWLHAGSMEACQSSCWLQDQPAIIA